MDDVSGLDVSETKIREAERKPPHELTSSDQCCSIIPILRFAMHLSFDYDSMLVAELTYLLDGLYRRDS